MSSTREIAVRLVTMVEHQSGVDLASGSRPNMLIDAIDKALRDERERCAMIAESHYVNHRGDPSNGNLIHEGQCHQVIAAAIREGEHK